METFQNIPSRETFNKLSKRASDILKPDGTNAILDELNLTLKEARSVTKELRILPESKTTDDSVENTAERIEEMLDDISNGAFQNFLNRKFDILLPDMKIDVSRIDSEKTVDRCRAKIKEINKQLEEREPTEEIRVEINNLDEVVRAELESCCESFKKLNSKMANVEISEEVDMAKKRNLELEDRLRKLCEIVKCVKMFLQSKSEIVTVGETTLKSNDQQPAGNIVDHARLVERLLADMETVTYTLSNADNS